MTRHSGGDGGPEQESASKICSHKNQDWTLVGHDPERWFKDSQLEVGPRDGLGLILCRYCVRCVLSRADDRTQRKADRQALLWGW